MGSCLTSNQNLKNKASKHNSVPKSILKDSARKRSNSDEMKSINQPRSSSASEPLERLEINDTPAVKETNQGVVVNHIEQTPQQSTRIEQRQSSLKPVEEPKFKPKPKQNIYDLSPQVIKQFKIYNISSKSPVSAPYSRETEWQQVLQLYGQKLNMASFQQNIGGLNIQSMKGKKPNEIQSHLEQIQLHREIELMVKLLNLRNRNWVQEQIKMSRRLASMESGSFDSLVVTREYLQLKEHFNWLVWAVGFYYFQMTKIDQFFQFFANAAKQEADALNSSRAKQQNMLHQEINHLFNQLKNLKTKLPSPINKKWTEGFQFMGVHFRMLPLSDSHAVKNEMKGLKYIQTELMELSSIHNLLNDFGLKPTKQENKSVFKHLILPLLSGIQCGGFFVFGSPTIYIPNFDQFDEHPHFQLSDRLDFDVGPSTDFLDKVREQRSLTTIYGSNVYLNAVSRVSNKSQSEPTFKFLQQNIDEINDPLLKMMPLLQNLTKQNVIPIMDFDDNTQANLNFLLIHVFDCLPSVKLQQTVTMLVPQDQSQPIKYVSIPNLRQASLSDIKTHLGPAVQQKRDRPSNAHARVSSLNDSDFCDEDFEQELSTSYDAKYFSKHGFDIVMLTLKSNDSTIINKRAHALYSARETESVYNGLTKAATSEFVHSLSQVEVVQSGPGQIKPLKIAQTKDSILRKNNNTGGEFNQFGMFLGEQINEEQVCGNSLVTADNSLSSFKLKYALINHGYSYSIEQILIQSVNQVAHILQNTDTINNIQALKDLMSRKGLNLRFQWILLAKLKNGFHRELVMIHILCRVIGRVINEETKLKAQVITPNKAKLSTVAPKSLAEHQKLARKETLVEPCDHFMGNQQETFRDNIVFLTNTLLRRKFSKQKHVFDETLIGLFLARLKIIPIMNTIMQAQSEEQGDPLMTMSEVNYILGKNILDEIVSAPSQNPALYINAIQTYFNVEIESEFLRKCRQDKYLFLSQLTSAPMMLKNLPNAQPKFIGYFSVKEFAYFMLANQVYKQQSEAKTDQQRFNQIDLNQSLRQQVFRNQQPTQKNSPYDLNSSRSNLRIDLNSSMITDKRDERYIANKHTEKQTPRQFNNIDALDTNRNQNEPRVPELIIPSILYKLNTSQKEQRGEHKATSNLLPFYQMPNKDVFNTWVMYLESILREVFSIESSEQVLLEALNYLALNIYFNEFTQISQFQSSPMLSPNSGRDFNSFRQGGNEILGSQSFDYDSFMKVCVKIKDMQAFAATCSPEVLAMSQVICALSFEQVVDDTIFPIESEKNYLTALICLFHLIGDPRGRGNHSVAIMLLITWKLSILSLCTENRKVHDSEFAEELFDSALFNLHNHKALFREHQNSKLYRVEQQPQALKKQKSGTGQTLKTQSQPNNEPYAISEFEKECDVMFKEKNEFDVNRFERSTADFDTTILKQQTAKLPNLTVSKSHQGFAFNFGDVIRQDENIAKGFGRQSQLHDPFGGDLPELDVKDIVVNVNGPKIISEYISKNFCPGSDCVSEVPFIHWSIYRQGIQNLLTQQGHKFSKNTKQLNKFLCQMYKNVLNTAIDKHVLFNWLVQYNPIMYQSGLLWKNNQIKQAVFFTSATMISSRSSSKSFQKDGSEYSLSLSIQNSVTSQGGRSNRQVQKTQHLGSYSSIVNTENGSINKGDIHGVIYSWGSDSQGQLGHDAYAHMTLKPVTQKVLYPRMISALKEEFIKEICCGYQHSLAITIHGNVYSWGLNECCQLGLGPKAPEFVRVPTLIKNLKNIVKLSAGNEHSMAINKNQELFSWGSKSQTGQNDQKNRDTPSRVEFFRNHKVQQVACGGLHTLVVTKDNKVFCWGSTEGGQLGLPLQVIQKLCRTEENAVKYPQQIVSLNEQVVTQVACGETHSLCLCKNGGIFGWGMSLYGQLGLGFSSDSFEPGLGMEKSKVMEPRKIETLNDETISKIFCGSTFSLFLTNNGELYGCGMNDLGQLGEDIYNDLSVLENARMGKTQTSDITIPTQVSSLQGISINTVACGESHVLAIDGDKDNRNMLWAWGQFKNGQLGLGEVNQKMNPRPVQSLTAGTINKIACGSAHSIALIGDASNVTTLSPTYYAGNEVLSNSWSSVYNQS